MKLRLSKYKFIAFIAKAIAEVEQEHTNEPGDFKLHQLLKDLPASCKAAKNHKLIVCIVDVIILAINLMERKKKIDFLSILLIVKKIIDLIERF